MNCIRKITAAFVSLLLACVSALAALSLICCMAVSAYAEADVIFTETFEDDSPTRDLWTFEESIANNATNKWIIGTGDYSSGTGSYCGNRNAKITHVTSKTATKFLSPVVIAGSGGSVTLSFWFVNRSWAGDFDLLTIYYRTDTSSDEWTQIDNISSIHSSWTEASYSLDVAPGSNIQFAFEHYDEYGYGIGIDDITITGINLNTFFLETFEDDSPTRDIWISESASGNLWSIGTGDSNTGTGSYCGNKNAKIEHMTSKTATKFLSPVMIAGSGGSVTLSFWFVNRNWYGDFDLLTIYYRTDTSSDEWTQIKNIDTFHNYWTNVSISFEVTPGSNIQFAFEHYDEYGYGIGLDDVLVTGLGTVLDVRRDAALAFVEALGLSAGDLAQARAAIREAYANGLDIINNGGDVSDVTAVIDDVAHEAIDKVISSNIVPVPADYDGDGKADVGVFDANGVWFVYGSSTGWRTEVFGSGDCIPVPADYDRDGKADLSVYDTVSGDWWIRFSSGSWYVDNFGANTCIPLPADYDGDGTADLSVYDQQTGDWFVRYSKGGWYVDNFGSNGCIPVPADYDGDGKDDYSVYDQKTGDWWIRYSGGGWYVDSFGASTCDPAPADHDGDGKADLAVYDQRTGDWFVRFSDPNRNPTWAQDNFGAWTCTPVPMDYDGDGKADFAVFDNATQTFWVRYSAGGWDSVVF